MNQMSRKTTSQMTNLKKLSSFLAIVLLASACSKPFKAQFNHPAPSSSQETGILVEAPKADVEKLSIKFSAPVREVSRAHHLYEVFNVSESEVRAELTDAPLVMKNVYFDRLINDGPAPAATPAPKKSCVTSPDSPQAVITTPSNIIKKPDAITTIEKSDANLTFTATSSLANPKFPSTLQYFWAVFFPDGSGKAPQYIPGPELNLVGNNLGAYRIIMLVRDDRGVCAGDQIVFWVNSKPAYVGPKPKHNIAPTDLQNFTQLAATQSQDAWAVTKGKGVTIAVLDSGVNYNHPDLVNNIAINTKEIPANGIDDDQNGFVDDVIGWDFVYNSSRPYDDNMHGTHVAGLAAAENFGMAPEAHILPIKIMNAQGGGDLASMIAGIKYASDMGAQIINASFGGYAQQLTVVADAIRYAESKGVLFVAAAGNGDSKGVGLDTDLKPHYPSALPYSNILAVAATDLQGKLASYSNFGAITVHVAAPGGTITDGLLSSLYENPDRKVYVKAQGTSMATPVAAGIAALVMSANPKLNYAQVKEVMVQAGNVSTDLLGKTASGKMLTAKSAVAISLSR